MHFPKFWMRETVRENGLATDAYGWSDESQEEAREHARENARKIIQRLSARELIDSYGYPRGVMREEVVERLESEEGEEAVLSRNRYGALVLNTAKAMFVDIDFPEEKPLEVGLVASILRLFKGKEPEPVDRVGEKKAEIERTLAEMQLRASAYQTRAGIRLLILNGTFDPTSEKTREILLRLKSDPLYIQLTQNQKCFRARLTPKPWRIGMDLPPRHYPRITPQEESDYQSWLIRYLESSRGFGICTYLGDMGIGGEVHPQARYIRELHDEYCVKGNLPLA